MPEWTGITLKSTVREQYAEKIENLFGPFKLANWEAAFDEATFNASLVNSCELRNSPSDTPRGWTLLHFAASAAAPAWVAARLVESGAVRCAKDWLGRTPLDLAKANADSSQELVAVLTPEYRLASEQINDTQLDAIEGHFHSLIREVSNELSEDHQLALLPVRVLLESSKSSPDQQWNFPIPGMYGGFYGIHLVPAGSDGSGVWHLLCDSWCRVVGGSGRRDKVTADGCELLESGFV